MNDGNWRRYISLYTTEPISIDSSGLVASLEKAFEEGGLKGPYNTETNAPDKANSAPTVKVETSDGKNGIWIGNRLIFMPVDDDDERAKLFAILRNTELATLSVHSYSLNSVRLSVVNDEMARQTANVQVTELLTDETAQEIQKNVTKQISETLTAKDSITIRRHEKGGLSVDMMIAIDSAELASGLTVGDILSEINFLALKVREDEIHQQANSIIVGR